MPELRYAPRLVEVAAGIPPQGGVQFLLERTTVAARPLAEHIEDLRVEIAQEQVAARGLCLPLSPRRASGVRSLGP